MGPWVAASVPVEVYLVLMYPDPGVCPGVGEKGFVAVANPAWGWGVEQV